MKIIIFVLAHRRLKMDVVSENIAKTVNMMTQVSSFMWAYISTMSNSESMVLCDVQKITIGL